MTLLSNDIYEGLAGYLGSSYLGRVDIFVKISLAYQSSKLSIPGAKHFKLFQPGRLYGRDRWERKRGPAEGRLGTRTVPEIQYSRIYHSSKALPAPPNHGTAISPESQNEENLHKASSFSFPFLFFFHHPIYRIVSTYPPILLQYNTHPARLVKPPSRPIFKRVRTRNSIIQYRIMISTSHPRSCASQHPPPIPILHRL